MAWWMMDDGCYSRDKSGYGFFRLSTQGYTEEENLLILDWLKERYAVRGSLQKCNRSGKWLAVQNTFVVYIGKREFEKLAPAVKPYFVPSLLYKLGCDREDRKTKASLEPAFSY
jgi:hypothetical protein